VDEPAPTVAWFSNDLFSGGGGAGWFVPLFAGAESLRWLHSSTAGLDNPLFQGMAMKGVIVTGAHIYDVPVSEFALRAVLDHFQGAARFVAAQHDREWRPHDFREIAGSTWAIVGLGAIGRAVATRARAFDATVIGVVRRDAGTSTSNEAVGHVDDIVVATTPPALAEAVGRADVVVLTASAEPGAPPIVDGTVLAAFRPRSVLVNVARGSLVDEAALLAALDKGAPEHAALDVMAVEPLAADSPLWTHPAAAITPHSAGQGHGRFARGAAAFAEKLRRFEETGSPD
jgi:phosphoglycerate dehydrogenase-like enzyme